METAETFPVPRSERRQHTEERILCAARELFSKSGYDRTTIRAVAAEADVDPALVMHYFGSKEDLFAAAIHDELEETLVGPQDELAERLLAKLADKLQKEPAAQLAMLRSMLTNEQAADGVRLAIARECAQMVGTAMGGEEATLRAELLSATMTGVLVGRYLLQLDRLRDADPAEITEILRPCFHALIDGDVEPKRTTRVTRAKPRAGSKRG
ncbi:MAG TPA: TetR family transcriptional regulator, partial [Acidimicrobiales bacterium]|nr:TetR family transcriptional regulator [Acidimicrobiales bacterium]